MSILIKNVSFEGKITNVLIEGNRFVKIGKVSQTADVIINGENKAILPGFYNTHCHAAMSILRGYGENKPLFEWLNDYIFPIESKMRDDDVYVASRLAILEMIKSGTVFFADMYYKNHATMKAVKEMGVRAAISAHLLDNFDHDRTKKQIENTEKFLSEENPCPERIIKCISCHSVYTVSESLLKYAAKITNENDLYLMVHACETEQEVRECHNRYGISPIKKLSLIGCIGDKTILAHAVHVSEKDISIIKKSGCYLSNNPTSNLKLNSGNFMFYKLYKDIPEKITLGTDGASSNNNLSMIEAMKVCSLSAKSQANLAIAGKADEIFKVAARNGAAAFGLEAGEIREGYLADCILVDLDNPFLVPDHNIISNMVYSADSSCVRDVICDGKVIMENGIVPNEKSIISDARLLANKLLG